MNTVESKSLKKLLEIHVTKSSFISMLTKTCVICLRDALIWSLFIAHYCTTMMVRMDEIEEKITPNFLLNRSVTKYSSISQQATWRDYSKYYN